MNHGDTSNDQDTKPSKSESSEVRNLRRQAQLRYALELAFENTEYSATSAGILGALGALIEDAQDAEAYEMIVTGVAALVTKTTRAQNEARSWHARRRGCDPSRDAISIVDLFNVVEHAAYLHARADSLLGPQGRPAAVQQLSEYLQARFGNQRVIGNRKRGTSRLPSSTELENLLSKHGATGARNRLTVTAHLR